MITIITHKVAKLRLYLNTHQKVFDTIKWVGNITTYAAALAIVISTSFSQQAWPFVLYLIGNIVWLTAAIIMRDRPLLWLHIFFFILNLVGIVVRV